MIRRSLAFLLTLLLLWLPLGLTAQTSPMSMPSSMAEADQLFLSGKMDEAGTRYQAIVNANPSNVPAQVGLIRTLLVRQKLDEAQTAMNSALAVKPNAPLLLLTDGDLLFRLGKLSDAERAYVKAQNLAPKQAAPYIGLARIYRAYSLYRRAYDQIQQAHQVEPNEVAVQLLWAQSLPAADRVSVIKAYIAGPGAQYPQAVHALQQVLQLIQQTANVPQHPCKLVSNVKQTNTKIYPISRPNAQLGASGMDVKLNKLEMHLAVDTGASGILIGRLAAEKAGLKKLGYQSVSGWGDAGKQGGYTAAVDRIRIGDLEFQDCVVRVTDAATPVTGQDGLIGTDVFSAYQIDFDIPGARLRLSPLPPRPNEAAAPASLQTFSPQTANSDSEPTESGMSASDLPKDAYVAPEMANWTKVYRFKHLLLVPTKVDKTGPMLFLLDTGSYNNVLSTRAAREVTQVVADNNTKIRGLSGNVGQVYRADKATLEFGRYEQANQDIVTLDLNNMCKATGTEVSGVLGFSMLRILQVQIDYRDGLVNFIYDPHHLPKGLSIGK